jgi:hypothetical protein
VQSTDFSGKIAKVGYISFTTRNFTGPVPPQSGDLRVSLARLALGAVTVGATPVALGARPRPLIELCWRAALVGANLEEDPPSDRWVQTEAYQRLDQSEKSAVSYFLGMTQAKITCEMLLGVPHLVHLDAVLAMLGQRTNKSRPDFVGFDLASMTYTIAVEAKGRTWERTEDVTNSAKEQARRLPTVIATSSSVRVASVASFEAGCWEAYLEDPAAPYGQLVSLTTGDVLVSYYRPLVAALLTAGADPQLSDDSTVFARMPDIDVTLGIPRNIVATFDNLPLIGPIPQRRRENVGARLSQAVLNLPGKSEADAVGLSWVARGNSEAASPTSCTGWDGIQVTLGRSWFPE